ncbi:MAG: epoxide hydrolase [Burkholderiaceae bacterium]
MKPTPFELHVDQAEIDDLRRRLAQTRWPDEAPLTPWSTGTSLAYLRELVRWWQADYDWRRTEASLNALPQFRMRIDDIDLHYIHVPGRGPAGGATPLPLLLSHGWPGSVLEFVKLIPLLTDPAAHGGDARDAFTVVAPSLPGYTLSFRPGQARKGVLEIAAILHTLMTERLGYPSYGAQGGDWGSFITARLAATEPQSLVGIHLNMMPLRRDATLFGSDNPEEARYRTELDTFLKEETGYQWIQGTRPQTLAFALADSPVGLAAWLVEKFQRWTDCDGDPENALTREEMIGDIAFYWFTNCIGASFWPYFARMHGPWPVPDEKRIAVPTGYAAFPKEILQPPRVSAERVFDIRRWTEMPRGGHFAALEQPEALAAEIRAFFAPLR